MRDPSRARVTGPLQEHAAGFCGELSRLGYTAESAGGQMFLMGHLSRWLAAEGLGAGGLTPETAARFLAARRAAGYRLYLSPKALVPLLGYLRRLGAAPEAPAPVPAGPTDELLACFQRFLVSERGLGASTAADYAAKTRTFLAARAERGLGGLTAAEVTAFVVETCPGMRKGTAKLTVTALRSLLGWLHLAGEIPAPLAWAVPAVASWRLAALPAPLEPAQVAAMLGGCDTGTPAGLRDKAMLVLLARLGLRAGEVAGLLLDDIDWRAGEIAVTGKGRCSERLPLPADAGEAVAAWLADGRPAPFEDARNVFLRIRAPHRALTPTGVSQAVLAAGQRAGIEGVFAHRLRHSAATGMLRAGASLPEVGQVLRHRRLLSTAIYAKTDVPSLRALARPWPAGSPA
ncbi:MAG TPA: site-specific integrase [Streptosporangiaceae bacterium]|nr:site-specific integrase [Streptosporangiaceae bacterium]